MAFIPTGGLGYAKGREGRSQAPYVQAGVQIGRVIAVYRQNHTVDLAMGTGELWRRVHVAGSDMGTRTGEAYLPTPSNQVDEVAPDGPVGNFNDDGNRSMYAIVGFVNEDPNHPLVLGFLHPRTNQMLFDRPGFKIERHESDLYTMVENGAASTYDAATDTTIPNFEWVHPSGFFLRLGQGITHEDLTGQDVQKRAKFRGTANANTAIGTAGPNSADFVPITVKHPSGSAVEMDTAGNVLFTPGPAANVKISNHRVLTTLDLGGVGGGGGSSTLAGDTDVTITSPVDGQILTYDAGSGTWINTSPPPIASKTANYSMAASDGTVVVKASNLTITLPNGTLVKPNRPYTIKVANFTNTTIATVSSQTIDGALTQVLSNAYTALTVIFDGTEWWII